MAARDAPTARAEQVGQLLDELEVVGRADAAAAGDDDRRLGQLRAGALRPRRPGRSTLASLSASPSVTSTGSTAAVAGAGVGRDRRTAARSPAGCRVDTFDFTIVEPAKTTWVAVPSASSADDVGEDAVVEA